MQTKLFMRDEYAYRARHLRGAYRRDYCDALKARIANPYPTNRGGFADAWDRGWKDGYDESSRRGS